MSLPEFAIQKKVTIVMVTLGLIVVGLISFFRLPQELFPPITFPQVTIVTDYTNAAPEEIETLITKPIEEAIGSVSGLKRVESVSREGRSTVLVSFNWGQDIDFAALAIREKIDLVKERLPKEAEDPVVLKFDPLSRPIMILSVTGQNLEPVQMKLLAEKTIKDNLEKLDGVASASISGGVDREIIVEIDQSRLQANHLSLLEIIEAIEKANVSYPAGSIKKGLYEYLIRTVGEFRSVKEIGFAVAGTDTVKEIRQEERSFVEKSASTGPRKTIDALREEVNKNLLEKRLVLIRDIAEVVDGLAEKTSVSRYNGKENISISIQKQADANTIKLVDQLRKNLDFLAPDIQSRGLTCEIIYDHSIFIRRSLENLLGEAVSGGVLAFLVLLLFLRAPGPSLAVTFSIPLTVIGVFFLMSLTGITLNIMSLGGLALGVGMIVDTSIVVLENIFRRRQSGESAEEGAIRGTSEVIWPVISSNMTTIAVFFPLIVFVPGIPGQLFKDLSWTVIFSQIISTIIPLTVVTMISVYLKVKVTEYKPITITDFFGKRLLALPDAKKQNQFVIQTLLVAFAIFSVVFFIFPTLEKEVLPKVDQGQFLVKVDMPIGTRLEVTDRVIKQLEDEFRKIKDIESIAVTIGSEATKKGEVKIETLRPSQALVLVTLHSKRDVSSADVVHLLQAKTKEMDLESAEINFVLQESEFQFAEGGIKPILIEVRGYDFVSMKKLVDEIKDKLAEIKGVTEIQDDMGESSPETKLDIDRRRAALYGISALDVSLTAKAAIEGVVATQYREAGKEFDIRVRLAEADKKNTENLNNLLLYSQVLDALIPLKEVAEINRGLSPSEIRRSDQERTITVAADIQKNTKSKDVLSRVQELLKNLVVPSDFQVVLSGKAREVKENFSKVTFAFVLAILLVYMIMASQFESFMQPLIIMVTVPLSFVGVALALWVTGTSLNIISLLGIVLLGGVVVNNGIMLIEYINQLRAEGMDLIAAAVESARIRTRPILMSATTTIMGLLPLALGLGEGAELRSPMAITVMGGLFSSTLLTLVVVPSLYVLVTRFSERLLGESESESEPESSEETP